MKHLLTGIGLGLVFLIGLIFLASTGGGEPSGRNGLLTSVDETTGPASRQEPTQKVVPLDLTGPFNFAGEEIPMDNFDVRERLDQELMRVAYFHRSTLVILKRRARYFPVIERILAEEGLPDDLKYLAVAESSLANAKSPAGARGVWQFMSGTGKQYGLEINKEVDERYHLEKATRAACKYLKRYYDEYGDWRWVAAAYNMGPGNVRKWRGVQRAETIFDLDINAETMAYVFRIVAIKTVLENPESFGYYLGESDHYPPLDNYRTVTVKKSIPNLGDFAVAEGTNYRMLKIYNPWLTAGSLPISTGNSYEIRIPQ